MLKAIAAICFVLVSLVIADWGYSSASPCDQTTNNNRTNEQEEQKCPTLHGPVVIYGRAFLAGFERLVDDHEKSILVIATIIIGFFTGTLWFATNALVKGAEDTSSRQLRAYLGVDRLEMDYPSLSAPDFTGLRFRQIVVQPGYIHRDFINIKIRNYGQTPAHDVSVFAYMAFARRFQRLPDNFFDRTATNDDTVDTSEIRITLARFMLHPNSMEISKHPLWNLIPIKAAIRGRFQIYIFGRIHYRDIYQRKWRTRFCYAWEPFFLGGGRFVPYEQYNGEDQRELIGEAQAFPNRYS